MKFNEQLFRKNGAPTYQMEIEAISNFGQVIYREYNKGNPLYLDEQPVGEVINTFDDVIKVQISNNITNVDEIKQTFKTLTISKYNQNMILQQIKLKAGEGLIIESQNWLLQGTICDYKDSMCMFVMKINSENEYEYVGHWNNGQSEVIIPFEFETISLFPHLLIVFEDCRLYLYNELPVRNKKVKCVSYVEFLIQQLHYTNYSNYQRIEFTNKLTKKAFMDQFLLKSDVIKWIAQDLEYEDNQNYQLFKKIRYKEEISYQIPEIFIALGSLSTQKYIYIHNQSIEGECLFGSIQIGSIVFSIEVFPSQHFVHVYESDEMPVFALASSIWKNRISIPEYTIELFTEDKRKLIHKIKQKGKHIKGRFIYATKKMLQILFHGKLQIVTLQNLLLNDIIGEFIQLNDTYKSEQENCIMRLIPIRQQLPYQYQILFL